MTISGQVVSVAQIKPRTTVRMSGAPGDTLESVVTITPAEKYNFSITGITQRQNQNITAELIKPGENDRTWKVKFKSTSQTAQDLFDVFTLKTDSSYKPQIVIRAYVSFRDKNNPGKS